MRAWEDSGRALEHGPGHHVLDALRDAQAAGVLEEAIDAGALAAQLSAACLGALHLWAAGMIGDDRFRRDVAFSGAIVLAAAARPAHRDALVRDIEQDGGR